MKEIRIHGRGGQGSVTAAELLAQAAFEDGWYSQAFPSFGVERRGAPVTAFVRLDEKPIRLRGQIYTPDYVIIQDPTLVATENVLEGLKDDGLILINSAKSPEEMALGTKAQVRTVNATQIAVEELGRPIVNTLLLGAFAGATGLVSVDSIKRAVLRRFSGKVGEMNAKAIDRAYELMGGE
ncbi:pyruvate ferredoxin oxidoreductase subunit gamma [Methermicoccus shengliensis]|uniref:pyruvate synthase n=1 Tax=Methermicoccus shengliensis TaxID=660064 RepID=A0A832VZV7_9EURY|nr:pyruvate ferredoxin oxidoreductase subunit gamma [Methermicoccus shengliensis]KUK04700.1 MAG: Pyruvate synthase, subunit gamma [Euryarchaeota archaeon 55_53]KUK30533.1 MAG: Pyruvate synthase, subunit gamma [Methanosarcinales archeaon 56_1174]MDI3487440.1 pyruvate ferredoxin oxidoreductase gamma subunit [Methanosarcinales archaeon]MDN5295231.1 pyruvate ferredoxin oxidoreductase gamma subunit [Methanosarcinales archaeon]HIH69680.1 pyruvate ferredoxin oxidoreductase subunit gamma [Methermicocc